MDRHAEGMDARSAVMDGVVRRFLNLFLVCTIQFQETDFFGLSRATSVLCIYVAEGSS